MGAPSYPAVAGYAGIAAHGVAAAAPVAYAAAGPVADTVAHAQSVAPAPLATHPLQAGAVVPHPVNYVAPPAPAPYSTRCHQGGSLRNNRLRVWLCHQDHQ